MKLLTKGYTLESNLILDEGIITSHIQKFWKEVVKGNLSNSPLAEDTHLLLMVRIQYEDDRIVTLGKLRVLNREDLDYLIGMTLADLNLKIDWYRTIPITRIIFQYLVRKGNAPVKNSSLPKTEVPTQNYYNNKLPIGVTPSEYGRVVGSSGNTYTIMVDPKTLIMLTTSEVEGKLVNTIKYFKTNLADPVHTWTDTILDREQHIIRREIGKSTYVFDMGVTVLHKVDKTSKSMSLVKSEDKVNNKFITMDIETVINQDPSSFRDLKLHVPYLICWSDGMVNRSYFKADYQNDLALTVRAAIEDLLVKKYRGYKIYLHNLGKFDGILLMATFVKAFPDAKVIPLKHNGRLIAIKFIHNNRTLLFKDSLLLMPVNLRRLGSLFPIEGNLVKGIFPYLLDNIHYEGPVPSFDLFDGVEDRLERYYHWYNVDVAKLTRAEYTTYASQFEGLIWSFKEESIKYCLLDCRVLYKVLLEFNTLVFSKFHVNIHNYLTLPALAMGVYRSKYLPEDTIYTQTGKVEADIREAYSGGAVDVYIPINKSNKKVYGYDVNSLFPAMMRDFSMPTGKPTWFSGDIRKFEPSAYGFFRCKVTCPDNLMHPIIQLRMETPNGIRTIAPTGTFETMVFSPEMDNAIKYGYTFEILSGYLFTPKNIFKDYVDDLYNMRTEHGKGDPMNVVAKLLLNSLYGKFAMSSQFSSIETMSQKELDAHLVDNLGSTVDIESIGDSYLVHTVKDNLDLLLENSSNSPNVSIAISAAISALGRVHMSHFKNRSDFKLYYTDTDSIYIDRLLPAQWVSDTELGKMKLESISKEAVFLAPKVYALLGLDNTRVIKVKGLNRTASIGIEVSNFKALLFKNESLALSHNILKGSLLKKVLVPTSDPILVGMRSINNTQATIGEIESLIEATGDCRDINPKDIEEISTMLQDQKELLIEHRDEIKSKIIEEIRKLGK